MSARAGAARTTPLLPLSLAPPPPPPASKQHKSPAFGRPALLSREASSSSAHAAAEATLPVNRAQLLRLWQRKGGGGGNSGGGGNAFVTGSGGATGGGGGGGGSGVRPRRLLQMLALLLAASGYGLLLASNALVTVQQPLPSPPQPHFQSPQESVSIRPLSAMQQAAAESSPGAAEEDAEQPGGFGEMGPEAMEAELEERRQTVHRACAERGLGREGKPNAWEFFIDEKHRLVWCNVFKAASTSWLYKFNLLGGYKGSYLRRAVKPPLLLARARFPRPTPDQLLAALPDSLSFLIAREPFERLLSAYRNKLEGYRNRYYRKLAREIARRPRRPPPPPVTSAPPPLTVTAVDGDVDDRRTPGKQPPPLSAMLGPTFEQFIDYVIETGLKAEKPHFDEHWAPIHKFCTPCHVNFTVIAKMETLTRDEEYIIRRAGLKKVLGEKQVPRKLANRARGARATAQLVAEYFATITQDQLRDLYTIYGTDFEMFGYNVTKYYDLPRSDVAR